MAQKLTEHHPLYKKAEQIFALMDELDVEFVRSYNGIMITDKEGTEAHVLDLDDGQPVQDLPPFAEYKLIIAE